MTDTWTVARPFFERGQIAHLATLMPDGSPHSAPIWIGVDGEELVWFTIAGSLKDRNVTADPRVAVSITAPGAPFNMAHVRGRVTSRVEGEGAWQIVDRLAVEYTGEPYPRGIDPAAYRVRVTKAWSKDYSRGPKTQ
ncbi:TIGR03618 family F420-dependent PPOX class oxidoreductase [Microbacterium aquimaris]|uniref:TIGR03618 family F420-dependent PPOX class oxidoreductase n=1 Tax=Microbacterium aquimaris TaxID=459816 RepID=UPI002AD2ABD1|nr:TIGR03618 family F420-dependent PPOX class oxidoreductase [Microbacterium aquimaris]MDZ8274745.1 TIGR03618 family F420-dependent PPOX class oxidoreductase [Microbacterium aquimaris]